jgi:hypothetical protein
LKHSELSGLKAFLKKTKLKYSSIYQELGYTRQRFSDKINGRTGITLTEMEEILLIVAKKTGKTYTMDEAFRN